MHGIIHAELKKYVETKHGFDAWKAVLNEAGLSNKIYMAINSYPDEEAHAIVRAASTLTETPVEAILEDFGKFISPTLLQLYRSLINPEWATMELLLNTEDTVHRVVRRKNTGAEPPRLKFEQTGPDTLKFIYTSRRRMSALAKGIIKGVATHYGETAAIQESTRSDGGSEMQIKLG